MGGARPTSGSAARALAVALMVAASSVSVVATAGPANAGPVAGGLVAAGGPAAALVPGSGAEPAAKDLPAASAAAATLDEPVEVADRTTATVRHLARPDGGMTFEAYATPQRVSKGERWVPVDTTLRVSGPRVVPTATLLDMSLSPGGSGELIRLVDGDRRLSLTWPTALPAPVLAGDTATYRNVLPGVDLEVRAEADSFAQALVVRTAEAARNPALARLSWTVTAVGLSVRVNADGSVTAADASTGAVVFASPPPMMWDAAPSLATDAAEVGPRHVATMPVELSGNRLTVRPDQAMLAAPDLRLPVRIDPSFSRGVLNWAPLFREQPNTSWPSGSSSPRDSVRVGLLNWPACGSWCGLWRSALRFTISSLHGEQLVGNPEFRITLDHSASCDATPVSLWRTSSTGDKPTWNNMSDEWLTDFGDRSASANESDCPQPDAPMEWSTSTMRSVLQGAVNNGNETFTFGLRAPNEGDRFQWKRFIASTARLVATYNSPPLPPDRSAISDCYLRCDSPAAVRSLRPTLTARVRDSHSGLMDVQFQVRSGATVVASATVKGITHGATASWQPPSNLPAETLTFRVRASNADLTGPWSDDFTFTPDVTPPTPPPVASTAYPAKDTGSWSGGVGMAGPFTFGPTSADAVEYGYRWNGGAETRIGTSGAAQTITLAPPSDLEQVLEVRALDAAGNVSAWQAYRILVRPQPIDAAYWKFDDGAGPVATAATGGTDYNGTLRGDATWAPSGLNPDNPTASGAAVSLDGAGDYVEMPRAVATNHAAGFTVTAWANPTALTSYHAVFAQNGQHTTMLVVYYKPETQQWCLRVNGSDEPEGIRSWACSPAPPQLNAWVHLAAVYDQPAGKIRLWVNGGPNNGEPIPGTVTEADAPAGVWAATGSFTVGRDRHGTYFPGRVDEVRIHQRVLTEFEIQHTFLSCRYAACPPVPPDRPALVGWWALNDGTGPLAADSSGLGYHATLVGSAAWTEAGHDATPAIRFADTAGWLDTGHQIIVADQSFTVSAWVKLDQRTGTEQWVAHAYGQAGGSVFKLYYHEAEDVWRFALWAPDGGVRLASSTAPPVLGAWTHLAAVYDRATGEVRIYVNGQLQGTAGGAVGQAATSNLYIGASTTANFRVAGTVDDVRAYQSALSSQQVAALFAGTAP